MQLTRPYLSARQMPGRSTVDTARESGHSAVSSADAPTTLAAQFRPLDPGIINETIPAFFIGRNMEGFWVARDVNGRVGGIFLLENSAVSFARKNSQRAGCATIFPSETIELDLDNQGNPFVAQLGWLKQFAKRCRRRMVAFIDDMAEAMKPESASDLLNSQRRRQGDNGRNVDTADGSG